MDDTIAYVPQNRVSSGIDSGGPAPGEEEVQPMATPTPRGFARFSFGSGARPLDGYTIKRAIGRGGFGEVYYATSDAGKEVALKLLTRNVDIERRGVTHCMNLKSQHLITIFDLKSNDQGDTFVVMEYVSGPSLAQILAEHPNGLPPHEVRRWLKGLVEGVAYLHDHGIVHRDLKPANLMVCQGKTLVMDFGIARQLQGSELSQPGQVIGTPGYMAPEQVLGLSLSPASDAYALAMIAYQACARCLAIQADTLSDLLIRQATEDPTPLSHHRPDLPAEFTGWIDRLLSRQPEQRPCQNLSEQLRLWSRQLA